MMLSCFYDTLLVMVLLRCFYYTPLMKSCHRNGIMILCGQISEVTEQHPLARFFKDV